MKNLVSEIRKPICALAFTLSIVAGQASVIIGGDILNGNLMQEVPTVTPRMTISKLLQIG